MNEVKPALIASSPSEGPTIASSIIRAGAGNLPDFKIFAKSFASFKVKLPVIDDLHRILNDKNSNDSQIIIDGISMVATKLKKILSSYEVEPFESKGNIFNPEFHEAIMSQKSKETENTIIEEFEKGYKINDKIIRHSKVIVSKGKK